MAGGGLCRAARARQTDKKAAYNRRPSMGVRRWHPHLATLLAMLECWLWLECDARRQRSALRPQRVQDTVNYGPRAVLLLSPGGMLP
eukprot:6245533-Heterocapsa_arctica.AAC.1